MKLDYSFQPTVLGRSQKGQDSLIKHTFDVIGTTNKYCIEFGAVDGEISSNTWYFRNYEDWDCLLLDCSYENPAINLHKRQLTVENITDIFDGFKVYQEPDFLCIDIDGNDYWILDRILYKYRPRVIMVETCIRFEPTEAMIQVYNPDFRWNGQDWYGASPLAFKHLVESRGYTIVHIHLDDAIIVRNDCLTEEMIKTAKDQFNVFAKANPDLYRSHGSATRESNKWLISHDMHPDKSEWLTEEVMRINTPAIDYSVYDGH